MKFKNFDKQNLKSAAIIAFSLLLMVSALYIGFSKGRVDDTAIAPNINNSTAGLEDLVGNTHNNNNNSNIQDTPELSDTVDTSSDEPIIEEPIADEVNDDTDSTDDTQASASKVTSISLSYPVESQKIVMDFSYNTDPVFSKTFNEYRSDHEGVDFSAKVGEDVHPAANGTVSKIYEDAKLGYTIIIDHGDFQTQYSNLDGAFKVSEGDTVNEDTIIGSVGESAVYELAEDKHLHFALYIGGKCIDPKNYF